jgi:mono/diheme cytochrome c family protein
MTSLNASWRCIFLRSGPIIFGPQTQGFPVSSLFSRQSARPRVGEAAPAPASFPPATIARGAALAALGDCAVCHTSENGRPFASGRVAPTPFGIVFATNITPDGATGIGRWSLAAFGRALRSGIARSGRRLYSVLPYTHFTHATDADIVALIARALPGRPRRRGPHRRLGLRPLEQHPQPPPAPTPMPEGGGDRNSNPIDALPNARVVYHFAPEMPLRVSAMRGLGAYLNVFAIESFMDELAQAAGEDPVAFRLRHLTDPRGRAAITLAADRFGWHNPLPPGQGRGFAFARYKNLGAYCAIALSLSVEHETGEVRLGRAVVAVDSGQAINPDGIENQIEGAMIQSASWTLFEEVRFDRHRITSADWSAYPILRFPAAPASLAVHVIDRPGLPFLGTGEVGQGPMAAAIANARFPLIPPQSAH